VERPRIGRKPRERLEELEDPFLRQPVGDRDERGPAPMTKLLRETFGGGRNVPPRGHDSNPRPREACLGELLREQVARRDQDVRTAQREPIERCLDARANGAVVDSAGRLMEDGDHRHGETACRKSRARERSGDRVEQDGTRPKLLRPTKHCPTPKSSERERPLGKGEEEDSRPMRGCLVRHAPVVQVAAAQAARIAQRDEWENELRVVHDT
jgi:hypothetical protein